MARRPDFTRAVLDLSPLDAAPDGPVVGTPEGIDIAPAYDAAAIAGLDFLDGLPGFAPFVRGPDPTMYAGRPWAIVQQVPAGAPEAANAICRRALAAGATGLSIAFDGAAGVAIDSIHDMRALFDGIALDRTSVALDAGGAALPILALYILAAEAQGVQRSALTGTSQTDILTAFTDPNVASHAPGASLRIATDILAWTARETPGFNPVSVSGRRMRQAGASADLELAYVLSAGLDYIRAGVAAGLEVDAIAPRLSFVWAVGTDYFMEVAKLRAGRLLWAEAVQEAFAPSDPRSLSLRAHCRTGGASPETGEMFDDLPRTMVEAMAAAGGQTQSLQTGARRGASAEPADFQARIVRDVQLVLQLESGLTRVIDPWGGSFFVERLTHDLAVRARVHMAEVRELGGMVRAAEAGVLQRRIEDAAGAGTRGRIAVSKGDDPALSAAPMKAADRVRVERDEAECMTALAALTEGARGSDNLLELSVRAGRAGATVGQMSDALAVVFGQAVATAS